MKTFYALWCLIFIIILIVMSVSSCDIKLMVLTATVCLIGFINMAKEELKEELKERK